jgi:hypothetical protein
MLPGIVCAGLAGGGAEMARRTLGADIAGFPLLLVCGSIFSLIYLAALRAAFPRDLMSVVAQLPQGGRLTHWLRLAEPVR